MLSQVIAEGQRLLLFVAACRHYVNVMRMRPSFWSMKKGSKGVVVMGNVDVARTSEKLYVAIKRMQLLHGDLDVDH